MYGTGGMHSELIGIGELLLKKMLAVPSHQRSYAWEKKHVNDLFTDIDNTIKNKHTEYFLGSIYTTKDDTSRSDIVDGQQRIATIMILLSTIRDQFFNSNTKEDKIIASDITRDFLIKRPYATPLEPTPKLQLNEADNEFFLKKILIEPDSDEKSIQATKESHKRIADAAELARNYISQILDSPDSTKRLTDLIEFIDKSLKIIWVSVSNEANAFMIFETLNARGLVLAIFDKLKNYLFAIAEERIPEVQQRWATMIGTLESFDWREKFISTYIHHLWLSKHGLVRERALYSHIKDNVKSRTDAVKFATELADNAKLYVAIQNPNHELWQKYGKTASEHMNTLNFLRMTQLRPLVLSILNKFSIEEAQNALRLMVSWSVRFIVTRALGSAALENNYSERAKDVRNETIKTANQLKQKLEGIIPTDARFREDLSKFSVPSSRLARYLLRVLERQASGEKHPEFIPIDDIKHVNLEHIMPHNPSSSWNVSEEDRMTYTNRLGNLALLKTPVNVKAGNDSFEFKKAHYKKSKYILTSKLAQYSSWSVNEIKSRQIELADLAVKAWPLD